MNKEWLNMLFNCYPNGLERIKAAYRQEVLKTEHRKPQGRRTIGVVRTKVKDYNIQKKSIHQSNTDQHKKIQMKI
jgi:2-keto-3-deoxy-L-rhamnonate aldolase RhmA